MTAVKRNVLIWSFFWLLTFAGCEADSESLAQVGETAVPTATRTPLPTNTIGPTSVPIVETASPEPTATPAPEEDTAVPTPALPLAMASADGKVYLGDKVLLDIQAEGIPCFPDIPAEIIYAPTNEFFLVIPACIEGDNYLYLFRADGTGKQLITEPWDFLNFNNVTWAADGQTFVYERINSCCLSPPPDAPPAGLVEYDLLTGEKTLLATPTPRP